MTGYLFEIFNLLKVKESSFVKKCTLPQKSISWQGISDLKFGDGFNVIASKDGCTSSPTRCPEDALVQRSDDAARSISAQITSSASTKVLAFPNPYSDHIKFNLKSDISGHGSLELYNMIGQKVKNVFQGYIEKGQVRTIDFSVPYSLRTNLVYVFRIGDQRTTGKIINLSK